MPLKTVVIPAQAGIQQSARSVETSNRYALPLRGKDWIPACAGMTHISCVFICFQILGTSYLNFNVASPARPRMQAMIQKRMTTVGSDQPSFSK